MVSARHMPSAAIIIIIEKGKALRMVMVCSALSPPANSKAEATTPEDEAQNTRCHTGVCNAPPEASASITKEPESAEVTKNVTIKITVINETTEVSGNTSYSLNSATAVLSCTSPIKVV